MDGDIKQVMGGRGDASAVFHLAREVLAPIRPEHWQALATIAQGEMTPARVLTLLHILHAAADGVRDSAHCPVGRHC